MLCDDITTGADFLQRSVTQTSWRKTTQMPWKSFFSKKQSVSLSREFSLKWTSRRALRCSDWLEAFSC